MEHPDWSLTDNPLDRSRGGRFGLPSTLHQKGGDWRTNQAEMPSPKVPLPGPFVTPPSPDLPVAMRWLLTSAESRSSSKAFCTSAVSHR
jgi:hypothetical protein